MGLCQEKCWVDVLKASYWKNVSQSGCIKYICVGAGVLHCCDKTKWQVYSKQRFYIFSTNVKAFFFFVHNNQGARRRNGRYSIMRVKKHFKKNVGRYWLAMKRGRLCTNRKSCLRIAAEFCWQRCELFMNKATGNLMRPLTREWQREALVATGQHKGITFLDSDTSGVTWCMAFIYITFGAYVLTFLFLQKAHLVKYCHLMCECWLERREKRRTF